MAKYTQKEIGEKLKIKQPAVSKWVARGYLVKDGKYIDAELPHNKAFLESKILEYGLSEWTFTPLSGAIKVEQVLDTEETTTGLGTDDVQSFGDVDFESIGIRLEDLMKRSPQELDKLKRSADFIQTRRKTKLDDLRIEKLEGELIPTEAVRDIFSYMGKAYTTAMHQALDNLLTEFSHRAKLSNEETAQLRGTVIQLVNEAIENAVDEAKKSLEKTVHEYSEKRGRGESKQ